MKKIWKKGMAFCGLVIVLSTIFGALCVSAETEGADTTPPSCKISMGKYNDWTTFYEDAAFDFELFVDRTFEFEAEDNESGVAKIEYYKSDVVLTLEQAQALEEDVWTEASQLEVKVEDEEQFYLYVRATDNAGNQTIINTDGIVMHIPDEESPVTGQSRVIPYVLLALLGCMSIAVVQYKRS